MYEDIYYMVLQGLHFYLHGLKFSGSGDPKGGEQFSGRLSSFSQRYKPIFFHAFIDYSRYSLCSLFTSSTKLDPCRIPGSGQGVEMKWHSRSSAQWLEDWPVHSCSLLKLLSSEERNPQIPEEGSAREEQSAQGLT